MSSSSSVSLTEDARKQANLRVLQRSVDATIVDILASATQAVLYQFVSPTWQKAGVEGSLFLVSHYDPAAVQQLSRPRPQQNAAQSSLVILNRTSPNNFILPLLAETECQPSDDYVMLRQGTAIHGIWFHNGPERAQVTRMLQQVIISAATATTVPATTTTSATNNDNNGYNDNIVTASNATVATASVSVATATNNDNTKRIESSNNLTTQTAPSPSASVSSRLSPAIRELHIGNNSNSSNNSSSNNVSANNEHHQANTHNQHYHHHHHHPYTSQSELLQPAATAAASTTTNHNMQHQYQQQHQHQHQQPTLSPPVHSQPLDKKSLQLALLSLIQDERFLDLIHAQYLKVVHARASKQQQQQQQQQPSSTTTPPPQRK